MSKSNLEIYQENYSKLIELLVELHNVHYRFVKKPNRSMKSELRVTLGKMRELEKIMMADISRCYKEKWVQNKEIYRLKNAERLSKPGSRRPPSPREPNGNYTSDKKDI